MTRKKNRLATVEALYASRENMAGRDVAAAEEAVARAEQQLQLLMSAHEQSNIPSASLGIGGLQNRAEFLRKLDQAIGQQRIAIEHAKVELTAVKQRYTHCRQRTMAVGKVNAKRLAQQRLSDERRDQKEQDAWRAPGSQTDAGDT